MNIEDYILRKKKIVGLGKFDILYDLLKNKIFEFIIKYNNFDENNLSSLIFNGQNIIEDLKKRNILVLVELQSLLMFFSL